MFCRCSKVVNLPRSQQAVWLLVFKTSLITTCIFSHFCLWHAFYAIFVRAETKLFDATWIGSLFANNIILYSLLIQWKQISAFWNQVWGSVIKKEVNKRRLLVCKLSFFVFLFFSFIFAIFSVMRCLSWKSETLKDRPLVTAFSFGSDPSTLSLCTLRFVSCLEAFFYTFGFIVPTFAVPTLAGCLALLLANRFQQLNSEVIGQNSGGYVFTCTEISLIKEKYASLRDLVLEADKVLSVILMFWFLSAIISSCTGATALLSANYEAIPIFEVFTSSLYHYVPLLYSAFLSHCASRIPQACHDGYLLVRDFPVTCKCGEQCSNGQLFLLLSHLKWPPTGLTVGGLFLLNANVFISHLGCLLTYVVVMFQLYPSLMHKLTKENY